MRIDQLFYFLEVAKGNSINSVSDRLHLAQQTLSRNIKNLEQELGVVLFERSNHGLHLTKAGKAFIPIAQDITEKLRQFERQYAQEPAIYGDLMIYISPNLHSTIAPDILSSFCKAHPTINVSIEEKDSQTIWADFSKPKPSENSHRIALVSVLPSEIKADALFYPFMTEKFLACVSPLSPLAHHSALSIKTLLKWSIVSYYSMDKEATVLYQLLRKYGTPKIVMSTHSPSVYIKAIAENVGIGFLPQSSLTSPYFSSLTANLQTIQIKEDFRVTTGCLLPAEYQPTDQITTLFKDFLLPDKIKNQL